MQRHLVVLPSRRTVEAYRAVFSGRGGVEDARIVLEDLERDTGFRMVTDANVPVEQVKFAEGQRSVFARIDFLTRISDAAIETIEAAERSQKELVE